MGIFVRDVTTGRVARSIEGEGEGEGVGGDDGDSSGEGDEAGEVTHGMPGAFGDPDDNDDPIEEGTAPQGRAARAGDKPTAPHPTSPPSTSPPATTPPPYAPSVASTSRTADEMRKTVAELKGLSAEQDKLRRQAEAWSARVERARAALPEGVRLVVFRDVDEVESLARELVRGAV